TKKLEAPPFCAAIWLSTASTQLAAFHHPVEVHWPEALYHCCRTATATVASALKSSVGKTAPQSTAASNKRAMIPKFFTTTSPKEYPVEAFWTRECNCESGE